MSILKKTWKLFERFALLLGDIISGIVLVVFYYTIFALVAMPFRLFGKNPLAPYAPGSNWIPKEKTPHTLEDFKSE